MLEDPSRARTVASATGSPSAPASSEDAVFNFAVVGFVANARVQLGGQSPDVSPLIKPLL